MAKIDKTYHQLLHKIITDGFKYEDTNRKGVNRIQIPSYQFKHDFKDGFPAITTKKLFWKGVVGELLWFLRGETDIRNLWKDNIHIWDKDWENYSKHLFKEHGLILKDVINDKDKELDFLFNLDRIYGAQWRNWKSSNKLRTVSNFSEFVGINYIDQISNLIKGLKETPMGTKHIVTAWNPAELDDMALPPCHWSFEILVEPIHWKSRLNKLEDLGATWESKTNINEVLKKWKIPKHQFTLKWHQRSVDTFLGLPFNIASYALLSQIIGKLTNMVPKGIIGDLSNVHIYEPHLDAVKKQLSRSTDMHNSKCELEEFGGFKMDMRNDFDQWLSSKDVKDFKLTKHNEQLAIPAEMLPYNK
jgi:thymidylate synthase